MAIILSSRVAKTVRGSNKRASRPGALHHYLGKITDRTLSANLKELEADGLVVRKEYPQVPPKVEYSLTPLGDSLMEVLDQLCTWGEAHMGT